MQVYYQFSSVNLRQSLILNDFFVDENYRKKGLAKHCCCICTNMPSNMTTMPVFLETAIDNLLAQRLYESLSYQEVGASADANASKNKENKENKENAGYKVYMKVM